jgi:A/G-specific adenine glycosylase
VKHCRAHRESRVEELPRRALRAKATPRCFVAFVVQHGDRFLVRQRAAGVVNAHLWEFPNVELAPNYSDMKRAAQSLLGFKPRALEPICTIKHSITRYRMTLSVFRVTGRSAAGTGSARGKWLNRQELARLAFASAHKRILRQWGMH